MALVWIGTDSVLHVKAVLSPALYYADSSIGHFGAESAVPGRFGDVIYVRDLLCDPNL
ncbi:MAG: hypothetical protein MK098_08620 [Marinovum sp.]|nr:hypothetical protein [Marinovum sp.]